METQLFSTLQLVFLLMAWGTIAIIWMIPDPVSLILLVKVSLVKLKVVLSVGAVAAHTALELLVLDFNVAVWLILHSNSYNNGGDDGEDRVKV